MMPMKVFLLSKMLFMMTGQSLWRVKRMFLSTADLAGFILLARSGPKKIL